MGDLFSTQKQKSYQSNSVSLPGWMQDDLSGLASRAISASGNAYPTWQGPAAIGMTPEQEAAQGTTASIAGYQPNAVNTTGLPGIDLSGYLNPNTQYVIDAANTDIDRATDQAKQKASGQAAVAGAFGGDRAAIEQAELAGQGIRAKASTSANLRQQAFQNAQQMAETDIGRQLTADTTNAGLGLQGAQLDLSAANQLFGEGAVDQGYQQAGLNFQQNQNLQQATWPMQQLQAASGIVTGSAPLFATQNTVATTPGPSMFAQLIGLGASAGGAAMGGGGLARGGIADLAHGGAVIEGEIEEAPDASWMPHEVSHALAALRPRRYADGGEVEYLDDRPSRGAPREMISTAEDRLPPADKYTGTLPGVLPVYAAPAPAALPEPEPMGIAAAAAPSAGTWPEEATGPAGALPVPPPAGVPPQRLGIARAAPVPPAALVPGDDPNPHLPQGIAAMALPEAAHVDGGMGDVPPAGGTEEGGGILGWARRHLVPERNPELGNFLMSTGAGIMASRSPFPLAAVGEGLQAGLAARRQDQAHQAQRQDRKATFLERRDEQLARAEDRDLDRAARTEAQRATIEQRREQAREAAELRLHLAQMQRAGAGTSAEARDTANRLRLMEIENRKAAGEEAATARRDRENRGVQDSANQEENRLRDDLRAEALAQRPVNRQLTELTGRATPDPLTAEQVRQINQAARERVAELHPRSHQARSWASEVLPRERWDSIKGLAASDLEVAFVRNGVPEPERQRIRRAADILRQQQ